MFRMRNNLVQYYKYIYSTPGVPSCTAGLRLRQTREAGSRKDKCRLSMQPYVLSPGSAESWVTPHEAEVVGQLVGAVSYVGERWACRPAAIPKEPVDWRRKALGDSSALELVSTLCPHLCNA